MSRAHNRWRSVLLAVVLVMPFSAPLVHAQDDLLDLTRRKNQVASQKLEAEVAKALVEVRKLVRTDPAQAVDVLTAYKDIVSKDDLLAPERRTALLRSIETQLRAVEQAAKAPPAGPLVVPPKTSAEDLRSQYRRQAPGPNVTDVARQFYQNQQEFLKDSNSYEALKQRNFAGTLNEVARSAVPPAGDMSFPKHWKRLSDSPFRGLTKLTKEEAGLLKTLNSVMSVDFEQAPLKDVIGYIQDRTGQTIILDGAALKEAMVEYDTPINFKARKVSVRTVLRKVLGDVGLAYILKEGVIQVVTPQEARETMVVRSYPISDLLPLANPAFGPFYNRYQQLYYANQVMNMIMTTVEPGSWAINGGRGTMYYNQASMSIVVRNSAELHLSMGSAFGR